MFWGIDAISSDFPTFADIKAASEVDFPVAPDLFLIGWDGLECVDTQRSRLALCMVAFCKH